MNATTGRVPLRERFVFVRDPSALDDHPPLHSALFEVEERESGLERTLKLWRKTGRPIDQDLRALWLHEVRQVERMMAYEGARRVIVGLVELVEDDDFFGILLERAGHTLDVLLADVPRQHWLRNLGARRERRLLWENVLRLVEALRILHAQGLVHGRLDRGAILSEGADEPDFLLSGFEWSLRLGADAGESHAQLKGRGTKKRPKSYSFADDWAALGEFIAELLGLRLRASGEVTAGGGDQPMPVTLPERALLKRLVAPSRIHGVDSDIVRAAVLDILSYVPHGSEIQTGTFILVFNERSGLETAVFDATEGQVETEARAAQLDWVRGDLGARVTLLAPKPFDPARQRLRLITPSMIYELEALRDRGTPVWDVAVCTKMAPRGAQLAHVADTEHTIDAPIELATGFRAARELRARLGASVLDWSAFALRQAEPPAGNAGSVRRALLLVQVVEAVVKALEIYPVDIVRTERRDGVCVVTARPRAETDRDQFAAKVGLMDTPRTLRRLFGEDTPEADAAWTFSRTNALGARRDDDVNAAFIGSVDDGGILGYEFEVDFELGDHGRYFLRPTGDPGTEQVIRRRLRTLAELDARADLADMLDDPWRELRSGHEPLSEDAAFRNLDGPKQDALRLLWKTLPVFCVVGPPGVGKTMLATEVVRRKFATEGAARVLLSAQGHDALEHLQAEVKKALHEAGLHDLLIVRSVTEERPNEDGADMVAAQHLRAFAASSLARELPSTLRARIESMAELSKTSGAAANQEEQTGLRAMANLVRDAANIVIATANSGDIERLVEAREQFDLVIVEEAAKATGPEIVGPLMLSGRRLLIGDHHQLPPFDADRLSKILRDDGLVQEVIRMAEMVAEPLVGDDNLAGLARLAPAARGETAALALRLVEPFRTFVEEDDRRRTRRDTARPLSTTLTEQRRMDPAIAEIVSRSFYNYTLKTEPGRAVLAEKQPPPFVHLSPMPPSPVVVVDFPHISSTGRADPFERGRPPWHNPAEVESVIDVLRLVRAQESGGANRPTLAILSPYTAQVKRLRSRVEAEVSGSLAHLAAFAPARAGLEFVCTVDAFQGSEADLVIVSLVRNNPRTGARSLGFLRDPRRMNVLLSRAKWQLVLVGSTAFLKEAVRGRYSAGPGDLAFLNRMLETVEELRTRKRNDGTPLAETIPPDRLRGSR